MRTIKDLKKSVKVYNRSLMVAVQTIDIHKDFCKEYKDWDNFEDDDSIDNLILLENHHCIDIFEHMIEIWVK